MSGKIYLIKDDGTLEGMEERAYDSEVLLHNLLASYPDLLAGDQIDSDTPRRWLLISREAGIPYEEGGSEQLSLDHLFLDQDAVPTFVEVKRSSDTRARREVVAQMLDYVANAVAYWPDGAIRDRFEEGCTDDDPDEVVRGALGADIDIEQLWKNAQTNLKAGRVRMLFVIDHIPKELQRIVEFLNEQMNPAQVLAVEVKQFIGETLKTLVPRVIGQTAKGEGGKTPSPTVKWDEASFLEELAHKSPEDCETAKKILEWGKKNGDGVWWGTGRRVGAFELLHYTTGGKYFWLISVHTNGYLKMQFKWFRNTPPFDNEAKRLEFVERLNAIPNVNISSDAINLLPSIELSKLRDEMSLQQFLETLEWAKKEILSQIAIVS